MSKLTILGVSSGIPVEHHACIAKAELIVGGKRHLAMLPEISAKTAEITPLAQAFQAIREAFPTGNVVVLASGDPLFYGIGKKVIEEFPAADINIVPELSSLQLACARFRIPWDDAFIVSLHGRNIQCLSTILRHPKTILLTDGKNSPNAIASKLLDYLELIDAEQLADNARVSVAQDLGLESEKLFSGNLSETAQKTFSALNITCLEVTHPVQQVSCQSRFGLTEEDIHHSRGLITKNEVRAATLHSLRLPEQGVFWDVGGGSGSISIEAARMNPELAVFTIERHPEEIANIKSNIRKFRCYNVTPVAGYAPEALADLPAPDAVFIGGSGGNLGEIVSHIAGKITTGGRCVINGVIEKTISAAPRHLADNGFTVQSCEIKVQRTGSDGELIPFNPITIITGIR